MPNKALQKDISLNTLSPDEARKFYDKFGKKQDRQTFYEARALDTLIANAALQNARSILEFGCGTGRLALELFQSHLSPGSQYLGIDISATMVQLASARLAPFGARAVVALAPAEPALPAADASVDRFISTYVLDLLSDAAVRKLLIEVERVLAPEGLVCLAGITNGTTPLSRIVMGAWQRLFAWNPGWVGGCRPTRLDELLPASAWDIRFQTRIVAWGVASQVLVASTRRHAAAAR